MLCRIELAFGASLFQGLGFKGQYQRRLEPLRVVHPKGLGCQGVAGWILVQWPVLGLNFPLRLLDMLNMTSDGCRVGGYCNGLLGSRQGVFDEGWGRDYPGRALRGRILGFGGYLGGYPRRARRVTNFGIRRLSTKGTKGHEFWGVGGLSTKGTKGHEVWEVSCLCYVNGVDARRLRYCDVLC